LPDYFDTAVQEIDDQIRALKDEAARLQAARDALTGGRRRRGRPTGNGSARTRARSAVRRNGRPAAPRARRGGNTRASQALDLVRKQPGITIPEIAQTMKIQPNYLYRVLPRLASDGEVKRDGQGWHPANAPAAAKSTPASGSQRRSRKSGSVPSATPTKGRRSARSRSRANGGRVRGATTASVLAALAGGDAMTASQVASKAGLARPTVSTTLSKLAKSGDVQKAARGYRLASTG
jgi:DNA-binding IscR family transcriptional regulator